jgi:hypothetical protein
LNNAEHSPSFGGVNRIERAADYHGNEGFTTYSRESSLKQFAPGPAKASRNAGMKNQHVKQQSRSITPDLPIYAIKEED